MCATAGASPTFRARNDEDLFYAFGYAMAQDRLFQLDYLRRKGQGRLAEILGPEGVQLDTIARTVGLNRIARAEWDSTPAETSTLLQRFSDGVNALIDQSRGNLPIEFSLLDYEPEAWSPVDCLAIAAEFRLLPDGALPCHRRAGTGAAGTKQRSAVPGVPNRRG